jgi:Iap family predicted aminopeptidase
MKGTPDSMNAAHAAALRRDLDALCDLGGRPAGSASEAAAFEWIGQRLRDDPGVPHTLSAFEFAGWREESVHLESVGDPGQRFDARALPNSASTPGAGVVAPLLDLGRGDPAQGLPGPASGRIVLIDHEYMFGAETVHRSHKLARAAEAGAAAVILASPWSGGIAITGSAVPGFALPVVAVDHETALRLRASQPGATLRLRVSTQQGPLTSHNLVADLFPGRERSVVLSAHVDGHDIAEGAIDNASGVVAVLAAARQLHRRGTSWRHGIRVCFFGAEEAGLLGSEHYLAALAPDEQATLIADLNVDSVGSAASMTAMTSGFSTLQDFVLGSADAAGLAVHTFLPFRRNSDHANFAQRGIPALRLVAGFDEPGSRARFVLTSHDTRDKVDLQGVADAAQLLCTLVSRLCDLDAAACTRLRASSDTPRSTT